MERFDASMEVNRMTMRKMRGCSIVVGIPRTVTAVTQHSARQRVR